VLLAIDEPEMFPEEGHLFGAINRTETGSYDLRPLGQPCIEAFFGGIFARDLEAAGQLSSFAIEELTSLLGSNFRSKVHPRAASSWARDRFAKGSYSHALPGHSRDRAILAAPVDGRLFFAGEATSSEFFSTAHGAYESGVRAANEVASSLGQVEVGTRACREISDPAAVVGPAIAQSRRALIAASELMSLAVKDARDHTRRPARTRHHKGLNS